MNYIAPEYQEGHFYALRDIAHAGLVVRHETLMLPDRAQLDALYGLVETLYETSQKNGPVHPQLQEAVEVMQGIRNKKSHEIAVLREKLEDTASTIAQLERALAQDLESLGVRLSLASVRKHLDDLQVALVGIRAERLGAETEGP